MRRWPREPTVPGLRGPEAQGLCPRCQNMRTGQRTVGHQATRWHSSRSLPSQRRCPGVGTAWVVVGQLALPRPTPTAIQVTHLGDPHGAITSDAAHVGDKGLEVIQERGRVVLKRLKVSAHNQEERHRRHPRAEGSSNPRLLHDQSHSLRP